MWLASLRGLCHVSLALVAGGSLFLLIAWRTGDPAVIAWSRRWQSRFLGIAIVYLACSAAAILFQAAITVEEQPAQLFHNFELLLAYVLDTWHGRTALAGLATGSTMLFPALVLAFKIGSNGGDQYFLAALSAIATLTAGIGPLSGHAAADDAMRWLVPLHVGHLVGMSLWTGGFPLWIAFALWSAQHSACPSPAAARLLSGFSMLATVCMAVIVISGLLLSNTFVE
jgi:putative copper export protein